MCFFITDGRHDGNAKQPVFLEHPVVGITATQAEIRVFDFINLKILAEFVVRIMGEHGRQGIIIEIQFVPGIGKTDFPRPAAFTLHGTLCECGRIGEAFMVENVVGIDAGHFHVDAMIILAFHFSCLLAKAFYFTEPEISRLLKILSPLDKSTLEELLIDPKERAAKRAKTAAERKEFMDFWSAESLEKHLQNPDVNISALAKIECYLYKALDDRMGDISECQNYYSLYTEAERDVAQKKVNFICTWIKEHPLDFDWTDEMEEANQQVQYQIYANKMLSYLKKNASAKEQFDTAVRFAIQYDVVDENNNVVTSYEPKIKFTMSLLANLELKIIFGTVPDALECHSYEEAVEHRNQFYEIVKKYSLGEVTGNQCVLNKMYDDMFAQKGSYAFYIQWLNNEFPSEVEYQKKLQETKGLKKILVMATKPNHLATIE